MKLLLIAVVSVLAAWGCYEISSVDPYCTASAVAVGVELLVTGIAGVAMNYDSRVGVSIRLLSVVFGVLGLLMNVVFAFFEYNMPLFVICNGVLLVLYLLMVQSLYKTRQ